MQSFRERSSGYHSNPPCYQQEPHELSRLETYRQHPHHAHPQHPHPGTGPHPSPGPGHPRSGYDGHSLINPASMPPSGGGGGGGSGGPKDCYSQHAFPGYSANVGGNGSGVSAPMQSKKPYRGNKIAPQNPGQHLHGPGGYGNHMGPGNYSSQYMNEGHLQQKWDDPVQLAQYEQELLGRIETGGNPAQGSSQYMDQNVLGNSQSQCHQPTTQAYTSPHHQTHPNNPASSPLMYPQTHLHYPQHSQSPSTYMEKCSPMPHCYKGYNLPPNAQYGRQISSHTNVKPGGYRQTQNSYGYPPASSRSYEQQAPLQALSNPQETHTKYPHYSQQNYCLSELSVRSPEQYYQTCSPSSSHSPARSVGRSPSYSSTPSPLMTNPESYQYSQPPMTPGAASSSSTSSVGMQEQGNTNTMLIPPRSHPSPSMPHAATHSYTTTQQAPTMKERFSEKLLSNPSLWSLNALTSQVENISNNVQQLLLSEALVANKKTSKRSSGGSNSSVGSAVSSKKGDEYKSPSYPDGGVNTDGGQTQEPFTTLQNQPTPVELHEAGYSSSSDEQLERGYYYCGQGRSPAQSGNNTHLSLDTVSSCSMTSPDDLSSRSGDSGVHNLTPDPVRCPSVQGGDGVSTPGKSIGDERSPTSITVSSPMKQESDSPLDVQNQSETLKENFEETAWTERSSDKELTIDNNSDCEREPDLSKSMKTQEKWMEEKRELITHSKMSDELPEKDYGYDESMYEKVQCQYELNEKDSEDMIKPESPKLVSPTPSGSSQKTSPFISAGEVEMDQYSPEKEASSVSTTPAHNVEEDETKSEGMVDYERNKEGEDDNPEEATQIKHPASPDLCMELNEVKEEINVSQTLTEEHGNNIEKNEEYMGSENTAQIKDSKAAVRLNTAVSTRESHIGDTAPQPHSAMPMFSALNDKTTPNQAREHIDHSDAKVLEPDSPQLPGKSIHPPAPSWADTPPSPKKGEEDMEPGIGCSSAVTPLTKPEPVAPSAQPRVYGRKHARGRRKLVNSGVVIRRQLSLEKDAVQEDGSEISPIEKPCMSPSQTTLFSDQLDERNEELIDSQTPKMLTDAIRSRMCTRSFNTPESPPKTESQKKRKLEQKILKPGPKTESKYSSKPGRKPGPKQGSKLEVKSGTTPAPKLLNSAPDEEVKIEPAAKRKPGPKPSLKQTTKPDPKTVQKLASKDENLNDMPQIKSPVGRPKGSGCKTKQMQTEKTEQLAAITAKGRKKLKPVVTPLSEDLKFVNQMAKQTTVMKAEEKEGRNMVLRSRKPLDEKVPTETVIEDSTLHKTPLESVAGVSAKENEPFENPEESTTVSIENIDQSYSQVPAEETNVLPQKRKLCADIPAVPIKKKRGPKPKLKLLPADPSLVEEVTSQNVEEAVQRPRRKRGPPKKVSDEPIVSNINENECMDASSLPTKTKVLPPRKGRGQKYEAMVQKITSPSSKKYLQPSQIESGQNEEVMNKTAFILTDDAPMTPDDDMEGEVVRAESKQDAFEHVEELSGAEIKQEQGEEKFSQESMTTDQARETTVDEIKQKEKMPAHIKEEVHEEQLDGGDKAPLVAVPDIGTQLAETDLIKVAPVKVKRKRWALVETTGVSIGSLEAECLIVTTPRLAKQKAIKNNHEMHLKQKRKKREIQDTQKEEPTIKEVNVTTEQQEKLEEVLTPTDAAETPLIGTESTRLPEEVAKSEPTQKKRGRKPLMDGSKMKSSKALLEHVIPAKVHKKPGPKPGMKDAIEVIEAVIRAAGCEQEEKEEREKEMEGEGTSSVVGPVVTVSERQKEIICLKRFRRRPIQQNAKLSFCPYVRLNNSRDFSSWCAIVNKPEDAVVFQRRRKKGILRMKNPFTVAKVEPHTVAMVQGPLVNSTQSSPSCALCCRPSNFSGLGDLCGPYYLEREVPRKILTAEHSFSNVLERRLSAGEEQGSSSKKEDEGLIENPSSTQGPTGESKTTRHRRYRRTPRVARTVQEGGPRRLTLRERFRRMKQLQDKHGGEDNEISKFQEMTVDAETKEHWAHENCAVWTKGIIMVAGRLYGLKEAATNSAQTSCNKCQNLGASLGCCWRGCPNKYHYVCAKEIGCTFHDDDFSIKCPKHEDL